MIPRYQTKVMNEIFSDEGKFRTWFLVEMAYLEAYLIHNSIGDPSLIARLRAKAETINWETFAKRVAAYDQETRHDVIAFLHALEDEMGEDARLIHVGLTSSDIVDTSLALLLKAAGEEITLKLDTLMDVLWRQANHYRGVLCLGRTHGQAAEPTTFGIKLLGYLCEFLRAKKRIENAVSDISVGKFSGAVGVYGYTNPDAEYDALKALGLACETIATQVVARDRHAALFTALATLAGSIERLAVEIRLLMHGQVKEVFEYFHVKQKGSSAMPHKKNPILSENLSGLMRLMRSYAQAALENQALWHERDISHSSVERVIAPDAFNVMDFALKRSISLVENLIVDRERMSSNIHPYTDILRSQAVMLALVKKGLMRQQAYEIVQKAAMAKNQKNFAENLLDAGLEQHLDAHELHDLLNKTFVVHHETLLFERVKNLVESSG